MNTQLKIKSKGIYSAPEILNVKLDNEISLILASDMNPMGDPLFSVLNDSFTNELFQPTIGEMPF